jgi:hypothetical protein
MDDNAKKRVAVVGTPAILAHALASAVEQENRTVAIVPSHDDMPAPDADMHSRIAAAIDKVEQDKKDIDAVTNNLPQATPKFPYYRINQETGQAEEITRAEYKKAMHDTFTVKHQKIPVCGHKFVPGTEPRHRNCEHCWFVFFQVHGELTQAVEEVFQKHGKQAVINLRGVKFLDNFLKFMATVAQYKLAADAAAKEKNGSTEATVGSSSQADDEGDGAEYTTYAEQEERLSQSTGAGPAEASD